MGINFFLQLPVTLPENMFGELIQFVVTDYIAGKNIGGELIYPLPVTVSSLAPGGPPWRPPAGPRRLQEGSRRLQEGPRRLQEGP